MQNIQKPNGPHLLMAVLGYDFKKSTIDYRLIPISITDADTDIGSGVCAEKAMTKAKDNNFLPYVALDVEAAQLLELKQAADWALLDAASNGYVVA